MPPHGQYAMGGGAIPTQLPEGIRLIPPGQGKKREADDDGPEKRLDSSDGNFYDLKSFVEQSAHELKR